MRRMEEKETSHEHSRQVHKFQKPRGAPRDRNRRRTRASNNPNHRPPLRPTHERGPQLTDFLTCNATEQIIARLGEGEDEDARKMTRDYFRTMEYQLITAGSSPMEILLARRVVYCFAVLQYFDALYIQSMAAPRKSREHALELIRLNQAHDRYLSAIQALNKIRRYKAFIPTTNIPKDQIFPQPQKQQS